MKTFEKFLKEAAEKIGFSEGWVGDIFNLSNRTVTPKTFEAFKLAAEAFAQHFYEEGLKADRWISVDTTPPTGSMGELLGFSPAWIAADNTPDGIRTFYVLDNEEQEHCSARYCGYHDIYEHCTKHKATHYMNKPSLPSLPAEQETKNQQ